MSQETEFEECRFVYHPQNDIVSDLYTMISTGWYILHQKTTEGPDGLVTLTLERKIEKCATP